MFIETVPNWTSPPAVLLREKSYRDEQGRSPNGICDRPWRRCCSTIPISRSPGPNAAHPVASTEPSEAVKSKKATKRSANGHRVMSFADLIVHLGTLVRNTMRVPARPSHRFILYSTPTALQEAAFRLLALDPSRVQ